MPLRLYLIRHGNTFDKGDTILRVGSRTDLPLSSSGREQAQKLGTHFHAIALPTPNIVMTSTLKRTQETARLALGTFGAADLPLSATPELDEIDYGIDDGQPENEVVARLGQQALDDWENQGIMPDDWSPRPEALTENCAQILDDLTQIDGTAWVVTSNGIARFFAAHATWDCEKPDSLKLKTGAYAILEYNGENWQIQGWNLRPD